MGRKMMQFAFICLVAAAVTSAQGEASGQTPAPRPQAVPRRVMAFYYPWYGVPGGPGGAGKTVHWGKIDAANKDIAASTHYPELGAYDSHDPAVIDQHCRWAQAAHIDTFIVSWWGHGDYTDRAMPKILDACARHGLQACIYYERVPQAQTAQTAAQDIIRVLNKYGSHQAHLKVNGKPVVFVYGRAVGELGLLGWLETVKEVKDGYPGGAVLIGDQFSYGAARVFDGVHTYNTAGSLRGLSVEDAGKWAAGTYESWVRLADEADKISTLTVIPGYDDTKIRTPGLAVERFDGDLYRVEWEQAIAADPHWVLVTSFNEWHEGSEIEPSLEFGRKYIDLTGQFAARFKSTRRKAHTAATAGAVTRAEKEQLRDVLQMTRIAILPNPESMAFWWLLDIGVEPEVLTWEQVVNGVSPQEHPMLLYCAGEKYQRTVRTTGDVDEALISYEKAGGCLVALPSLPWPFYYDENGQAVNQSHRFGLTLKMGWEHPPAGASPQFVQVDQRLPHVPEQFDFPTSGDLRWRPFYAQSQRQYVPLLRLRDQAGNPLGDGAAFAQLAEGGRVAYVWFGLLDGPYAEAILYDLFTFLADR
jgi:glycoprotein endo-alpha-1,2-mannosidase